MTEPVILAALSIDDGTFKEIGDAVHDFYGCRDGVLQTIHDNGMVTVSMGPGRVAVARPDRFRLLVTGVGTCGCAGTIGEVTAWVMARGCKEPSHQMSTHPATIPQLDDLL